MLDIILAFSFFSDNKQEGGLFPPFLYTYFHNCLIYFCSISSFVEKLLSFFYSIGGF